MNVFKSIKARLKGEVYLGNHRVRDAAYLGRMPAGSPGTVTRTHPASIFPALNSATGNNPVTLYGQAVMATPATNTVRSVLAADQAGSTAIFGVSVRPFPTQGVPTASVGAPATFNSGGPGASDEVDLLRSGSILVPVSGAITNVKLGNPVFIWAAANSGAHVLGGFEADATGGSTFPLDNKSSWNGPPDANNVAELCFNI